MRSLHPVNVDLKLPLFSHRSTIELNDILAAMGVEDAFNSTAADFSGINGGRDLYLTSFQQLTEFVVDGGDAAEAEAEQEVKRRSLWSLFDFDSVRRGRRTVGRQDRQSDGPFYKVHFNRQFLYVVRHNPTGLVLYIGRYYKPAGSHHGDGHGHHHHGDHHHGAGH